MLASLCSHGTWNVRKVAEIRQIEASFCRFPYNLREFLPGLFALRWGCPVIDSDFSHNAIVE
jgi:hypothetical protein